ncbi:uncharacterized protein BO80DRAFT_443838 [Aspergillus ibericus CBS 121593]|uniref:Uncharacterized protein n=1 Tax=Aspergillus ibericus CBS 121593 TaxID=1448316 RepID=A0A395H2C6_9EURO|nr:hypothetical protein BO80DRAFT_443838 [Aspergillus ibericus CBS 121593]RAL02037.1 hypothetical protein BO80DRAFT_443838 [Aspergillus ibericus CBS 121593]
MVCTPSALRDHSPLTIPSQPHADSSYFGSANGSKSEVYTQVLEQARGLVYGQRNWVR